MVEMSLAGPAVLAKMQRGNVVQTRLIDMVPHKRLGCTALPAGL